MAICSWFVECRQVGHNSRDSLNKISLPRQSKPEILKLTTNRVQSNLPTAFIFVSCEEKGYYRVVSVGQLSLTDAHTAGAVAICKLVKMARYWPRFSFLFCEFMEIRLGL